MICEDAKFVTLKVPEENLPREKEKDELYEDGSVNL